MSLFPKRSGGMMPPSKRPQKQKKPATKQDKLWMWLLLGCTVTSTLLYFILIALSERMESLITAQVLGLGVMIAYAAVGAGFVFAYIIYNRAFTRDNLTPDMLPDRMSEQQKADFIQSGVDRKRKSKWMIIVLFALFTPLAIDFLLLVALESLFGPTFGQLFGA